jgi:hypothetical protein
LLSARRQPNSFAAMEATAGHAISTAEMVGLFSGTQTKLPV